MEKDNKLEVRDLRVSFRTVSGKVQAVRGINLTLKEGETLAIVGESGSGKSVTSKAILGILAGNSIIEGGEILYDKADLLKMPEDEFYKIRGDKIAMIFQDPLSSLNPIMRIGRQLTEAMLLKGKARQEASRKEFNSYLKLLNETMIEAIAKDEAGNTDKKKADELTAMCRDFDKFETKHIELEKADNEAYAAAGEASDDIGEVLFLIEKNAFTTDPKATLKDIVRRAAKAKNRYVVYEEAPAMDEALKEISSGIGRSVRSNDYSSLVAPLTKVKEILDRAHAADAPNFFSMGYYLTFGEKELPEFGSVAEMNAFLRRYLDENFMLDFIAKTEKALSFSADKHYARKEETVEALKAAVPVILSADTPVAELEKLLDTLSKQVAESIDPLTINKDVTAYTFGSSIKTAFTIYKTGIHKNETEAKRFAKEQMKYDKYVQKHGVAPEWKVVPASIQDQDLAREEIASICERLCSRYEEALAEKGSRNYSEEGVAVIDHLKANAAGVVNKVTKRMAKDRALKLMEEVGISEPRKRFMQYPFEFSGGMRQRIVIAIALAADPDILICDEPTTALDVTIQAQILELINKLKKERNLSIIFITHDLGVVANMADKIAVMYAGKIVEYGTSEEIFYDPRHPYTWALLASMPDLDTKEKLEAIPGTPPNMIYPPKGDAFAARNKYALQIDFEEEPPLFEITDTHYAATWLLHPDAPKTEPPKIVTDRIARMKEKGEN